MRLLLFSLVVLLCGCSSWQALPVPEHIDQGFLSGEKIRVTYRDLSKVILTIESSSPPHNVHGVSKGEMVTVDMRDVMQLEVKRLSILTTFKRGVYTIGFLTIGVGVGALILSL